MNARFCEIWLMGHRGEWLEAARLAQALQTDTRERDSTLAVAGSLLAWVVLESYRSGIGAPAGEWQEAEVALVEAIAIVDHLLYYLCRVEARTILGAIYVYQGRLQDARYLLKEARQVARSQPTAWDEQSLLWLEAELARAEGRWPEALSAFEELSSIYQRLDLRWRWARAPGLGRCLRSTRRARGLAEGGKAAPRVAGNVRGHGHLPTCGPGGGALAGPSNWALSH